MDAVKPCHDLQDAAMELAKALGEDHLVAEQKLFSWNSWCLSLSFMSASELAAQLPALWYAHNQADNKAIQSQEDEALYQDARRDMQELEIRIGALEEAVLGMPAHNMEDVVSQLILLLSRLDDDDDFEEETCMLAGALRVLLRGCSIDVSGLISCYASHAGGGVAQ